MTREGSSIDADPSGPPGGRPPGPSAGCVGELLTTQSDVLRLIATGQPFESVLEALVVAVETHCPGCIGSILLMDDDGEHLRHGMAPGLPNSYNELLDGLRIGPRVGSCGTAAYRGEPVIVEDIQHDPLWEDYRNSPRPTGWQPAGLIRSCPRDTRCWGRSRCTTLAPDGRSPPSGRRSP